MAPTYFGEVASRYQYKDGSGELGIISSVTQPFCGNCTRLRLSPEGNLYTCLFSNAGTDVRKLLRSNKNKYIGPVDLGGKLSVIEVIKRYEKGTY